MNTEAFMDTLPVMGMGMLGIFIVTFAIIGCVWLLRKFAK